MAKLTRVTGKIFGETASTSNTPKEIGQFGSAKAGTYNATGDVSTIQGLSAWSNGWIDAVTPTQQFPSLPEMTGVHKVLSYQNAYLLQQGIPEWDSGTTYYTNGFCSKAGKIYISLSDENLNNDPESDTVNWADYTGNFANISLSNLNNTGTTAVANYASPANTAENVTLVASGGSYTATANGWFIFAGNSGIIQIGQNNTNLGACSQTVSGGGLTFGAIACCKVANGQSVTVRYSAAPTVHKFVADIGG